MMDVRFPLSLRNVEDLLHERGVDVSHETVRFWWNRFGPMFGTVLVHYRTIEHAPTSSLQRCLGSVGAGWFCLDRGPTAGVTVPPGFLDYLAGARGPGTKSYGTIGP